jgi:hypothetical protein
MTRLTDRSIHVLQHLARRGSAWPEASAAAIRDLRTRMARVPSRSSTSNQNDPVNHNSERALANSWPTHPAAANPADMANTICDTDFGVTQPQHQTSVGLSSTCGDICIDPSQASATSTMGPSNSALDNSNVLFRDFLHDSPGPGQDDNLEAFDVLDPFSGFDIPFWFEEDQDWNIFQNLD